MKIHRFIGDLNDPEISSQIQKVLKLKTGEQVILSDGKGNDALVGLTSLGEMIKYKEIQKLPPIIPPRKVHLYLAILKKENFELAVQKAVEAGVSSITPVITSRTIKTGLNEKRLEKIIKEASEQSGRSTLPILSPTLDFSPALAFASASEEKVLFHLTKESYVPEVSTKSVSLFIGPEGGFTPEEVKEAKEAGFKISSLGELTLRGETATIIATYRAVQGI